MRQSSLGARYSFEPSPRKQTIICPKCNRKEFSTMWDHKENCFSEYGVCNRTEKCGYRHFPPSRGIQKTGNPSPKPSYFEKKETHYNVLAKTCNFLLPEDKEFTIVTPISPERKKITAIEQVTISELVEKINALPPTSKKTESLNVLKGVYLEETSGENCVTPAGYLFFDLDYSPENGLNNWLGTNSRKEVKAFLSEISLFVCDSFSQTGITGCLLCEGLAQINNDKRGEHLKIAEQIYSLVENWILFFFGIEARFDRAQGKFRQVRFFPRQNKPIVINPEPQGFEFTVIESGVTSYSFKGLDTKKASGCVEIVKTLEICVVESEYSARIAQKIMSNYEWVSLKSVLGKEELFTGRKFTLFFPIENREVWQCVAERLVKSGAKVTINNLLQQKQSKLLFGDFILQDNPPEQTPPEPRDIKIQQCFPSEKFVIKQDWTPDNQNEFNELSEEFNQFFYGASNEQVNNWCKRTSELEDWFGTNPEIQKLIDSKEQYVLGDRILIKDLPAFLDSHFREIKANKCSKEGERYFSRLELMQHEILEKTKILV